MKNGRALKILLGILGLAAALGVVAFVWVMRHPMDVFASLSRKELGKTGMVKLSLDAPSGRLTYWKGGSGPALVLLHGVNDQAGTFAKIVPGFLGRFTVLIPDLPGHGESEPAAGDLSLGSMVQATRTLLTKEAPTGAVLVGNSMGAWIAFLVAQDGANVSRIVAVNGGPLRGDTAGLSLTPRTRAEAARLMEALRDSSSPRLPGFVLDDLVRRAPASQAARMSVAEMTPFLLDGRLEGFTVPVDLLYGASDQLVPLAYARKVMAQIPRARLTEVPRCGHVPQVECPIAFGKALDGLLEVAP